MTKENSEDTDDKNQDNQDALASIAGLNETKAPLPKDFLGKIGNGDPFISIPEKLTIEHSLDEILAFARTHDASDVHISCNNPIIMRKYQNLSPITEENISGEKIMQMIQTAFDAERLSEFNAHPDLEFVHIIEGFGRFRVTLVKQRFGWDFTARIIPMHVRSFEESGMPASCTNLTKWAQGLVLVTGPTGCGKTSSLSTLVDIVNESRKDHIITIENPIEMVYTPKKCRITQREVHTHTLSQANALKAALREDPDILVVSELRDLESIQLAVTAAETGHLVFGTMNTNNASQTISSLIDSFPPDERDVITSMISESLRGVICQQLIPKQDGSGLVPAYEILMVNSAVANMIRMGKIQQMNNAITTGKSDGMVLFDNSLEILVADGEISGQEAFNRAVNPGNFQQYVPKNSTS